MVNRKTKLAKRLLKEALIELLKDKPLNRISVKELCEKADLNRSTFYAHYQDIYALVEEISDEIFSKIPFAEDNKRYSVKNIEECIRCIKENQDVYIVLYNQGLLKKQIIKKSYDIFVDKSLQDGKMQDCDIEYYNALVSYCIEGSHAFIFSCLNSSISIHNQAKIHYQMIEHARNLIIEYSKK